MRNLTSNPYVKIDAKKNTIEKQAVTIKPQKQVYGFDTVCVRYCNIGAEAISFTYAKYVFKHKNALKKGRAQGVNKLIIKFNGISNFFN